jgi:hypothetical protein
MPQKFIFVINCLRIMQQRRELFKSRAVQILIATNAIGATVGFFCGPKIIEQIIEYRNFQDAQKLLQSANTLCEKTNKSIVSAEDIPKSIMDQLSVAGLSSFRQMSQ